MIHVTPFLSPGNNFPTNPVTCLPSNVLSIYPPLSNVCQVLGHGIEINRVRAESFRVQLCVTPWSAARQAPLSMDSPDKTGSLEALSLQKLTVPWEKHGLNNCKAAWRPL